MKVSTSWVKVPHQGLVVMGGKELKTLYPPWMEVFSSFTFIQRLKLLLKDPNDYQNTEMGSPKWLTNH